ncbi:MAG: formyl transferase [Ginsengibacter sp.]
MNNKIVLLAGKGMSTQLIYHSLKNDFEIAAVIVENPEARMHFLKRRIRKLGIMKVAGQLLFQLLIVPWLKHSSGSRIQEILDQYKLEDKTLPEIKIMHITSVNDSECIRILKKIDPAIVVVNGTRILCKSILEAVNAKFVNIHAGITPEYRGVHGGYWALVNDDMSKCGVTVHLVDPGIDTGNVIYKQLIAVTAKDNFLTYPLLQLSTGLPYLRRAINDILQDRLTTEKHKNIGRLWSHPTLWQYLYHRLFYNKK